MLDIQKKSAVWAGNKTTSCQRPRIKKDPEGGFFLCWQAFGGGKDRIMGARADRRGMMQGDILTLSGDGQAFMADLHVFRGRAYVVWSEWDGENWKVCLGQLQKGSCPHVLAVGRGLFHPALTDDGDDLLICWDELDEESESCIKLVRCKAEPILEEGVPERIWGNGTGCYRPAIAADGCGNLLAACDCFDGKTYAVQMKFCHDGRWGEEIQLPSDGGWASDVSLDVSGSRVTAVWQSIHPKGRVSYWSAEFETASGSLLLLHAQEIVNAQIWYAWNRLIGGEGGGQALLLGHNMSQFYIRYRKGGGAWGNAVLATDENGLEGAMYADGVLCNDTLFVLYQHSSCNGHQERMASIRMAAIPLHDILSQDDTLLERTDNEFYAAIPVRKNPKETVDASRKREWLEKNGYTGLDIYFGDLHGQSSLSDGLGDVDQYYHYAMAVSGQDFTALTDHDVFPDVITAAEWEYSRTLANDFKRPGKLATLVSYEWTANELKYDFGHKNVYYSGEDGIQYHASDPEGLTPDRLFERLAKAGAMAFPHHTAVTWGTVSAATDWDFHDERVQRNAEIFSRHAPFEKAGTASVYAKNKQRLEGRYVQDALKRGYHMGFLGGSDSHQMEHGTEGGITGIYMEELDRECLFRALYRRSVYATTGSPMLLSFRVNGRIMGEETVAEDGGEVVIEAAVLAPTPVKSVTIIKDNEDIYSREGCGEECSLIIREPGLLQGTSCYYYMRVVLENEHMGWSSPVWIRRI